LLQIKIGFLPKARKNANKITLKKMHSPILNGKSVHTLALFHHFIEEYQHIGKITVHPARTMIGICNRSETNCLPSPNWVKFYFMLSPFERPFLTIYVFRKLQTYRR